MNREIGEKWRGGEFRPSRKFLETPATQAKRNGYLIFSCATRDSHNHSEIISPKVPFNEEGENRPIYRQRADELGMRNG